MEDPAGTRQHVRATEAAWAALLVRGLRAAGVGCPVLMVTAVPAKATGLQALVRNPFCRFSAGRAAPGRGAR